ncbi:MAG: MoxR family ATPase [Planctomycetota bacterium]|nr:MAG: MoxR family ATPase [Planctomycetota bacterium]
MATFEELKKSIQKDIEAIQNLYHKLCEYFVGKEEIIELMCICTAAQEPLLLVGGPGTAKSDLVIKFSQALGLREEDYFEYMLTPFTDPSEILGTIDLQQLKQGKYIRQTKGKLPTAKVAFLDEIFKSNSAILNILLSILNERKFYQNGQPVRVNLKMLFAASNDIPESEELSALKDRFTLKVESRLVHFEQFDRLLEVGLTNDIFAAFQLTPWANMATLENFLRVRQYLRYLISGGERRNELSFLQGVRQDIQKYWPSSLYQLFEKMLLSLSKDLNIQISDRKVIKLYHLIRTKAFLFHGGEVRLEDLKLLKYIPQTNEQFQALNQMVERILSLQ